MTWGPRAAHELVYLTPHRSLARTLIPLRLFVQLDQHTLGGRLPAPLAAFGETVLRHADVIYIVESQIYSEFFAITETLAPRHQLGFYGGPLDVQALALFRELTLCTIVH